MSGKISTQLPFKKVNGIEINTTKLCNSGNYTKQSVREVKYIVMHYTGNKADSAKNNAYYFNRSSNIGASAHFFVDASSIWLSVPLNSKAWAVGNDTYVHADCRNSNSISIEMCTSGNYKIDNKTITNAAYLCAELCKHLNIKSGDVDKYVLRHYDVTHKICPKQMAGENNAEWSNFKKSIKNILMGKGTTATTTTTTAKPTAKTCTVTMPILREGDSGNAVMTLQRLLRQLEYVGNDGKLLVVDGKFGPSTKGALIRWQKKHLGGADGICGVNTWNRLFKG